MKAFDQEGSLVSWDRLSPISALLFPVNHFHIYIVRYGKPSASSVHKSIRAPLQWFFSLLKPGNQQAHVLVSNTFQIGKRFQSVDFETQKKHTLNDNKSVDSIQQVCYLSECKGRPARCDNTRQAISSSPSVKSNKEPENMLTPRAQKGQTPGVQIVKRIIRDAAVLALIILPYIVWGLN